MLTGSHHFFGIKLKQGQCKKDKHKESWDFFSLTKLGIRNPTKRARETGIWSYNSNIKSSKTSKWKTEQNNFGSSYVPFSNNIHTLTTRAEVGTVMKIGDGSIKTFLISYYSIGQETLCSLLYGLQKWFGSNSWKRYFGEFRRNMRHLINCQIARSNFVIKKFRYLWFQTLSKN